MSETSVPYLVSGLAKGPNPDALRIFTDPEYVAPTWSDVRSVIQQTGLTGSQIADLLGVGSRTVRKWTSPPGTANHTEIPYAAWRLLLVAAKLVEPPEL